MPAIPKEDLPPLTAAAAQDIFVGAIESFMVAGMLDPVYLSTLMLDETHPGVVKYRDACAELDHVRYVRPNPKRQRCESGGKQSVPWPDSHAHYCEKRGIASWWESALPPRETQSTWPTLKVGQKQEKIIKNKNKENNTNI